ncbi:MAG: hypothetical protein PVI63_10905 [Anaerolineae bacterium]
MGLTASFRQPLEHQSQQHLEHRLDHAFFLGELFAAVVSGPHPFQQWLERQMQAGRRITEPPQPLLAIHDQRASKPLHLSCAAVQCLREAHQSVQ